MNTLEEALRGLPRDIEELCLLEFDLRRCERNARENCQEDHVVDKALIVGGPTCHGFGRVEAEDGEAPGAVDHIVVPSDEKLKNLDARRGVEVCGWCSPVAELIRHIAVCIQMIQ